MASQVVAFLRRSPRRGTDWSQAEIAELYRIEHALLQARFSLETDRGVSDEGDPWFVFCRADGEVLVHITRSDEGYLLYGLGLPQPLTGRVIGDISKSFVNQIPLNIPRQTNGPQLFVHPAATLAIIIGMIFLANDDVSLVASAQAETVAGSEGAEPASDRSLKASVLAVLGKLGDGTLFGGRLDAAHHTGQQEGAYLNIVCTIAAVMMGTAVALDAVTEDFTQVAAVDDAAADVESAHAQSSSDLTDTEIAMRVDASVGDPMAAAHATSDSPLVVLQDDAPLSGAIASSAAVEVVQNPLQQAPNADLGAVLDHENDALAGDAASFDQPKPIVQADSGHVHASTAASEPAPEPSRQAPSSAAASPATTHHDEAGAASGEDAFQHVLKSVGLPENANPDRVLSQASAEILQSVPTPVAAVTEPAPGDLEIDAPVDTRVEAHLYPVFDVAARDYLTSFLQAFPESQAYYYEHSVIVLDGQQDLGRAMTVQVWEMANGATIAIVGHSDYPQLQHA